MHETWQDFRRGLRAMGRHPGYSMAGVVALALGIGACSAIFSVVNTLLLRPLPYREPDRLVVVWEANEARQFPFMFAAPPNFADWRDQNRTFQSMGAFDNGDYFLGDGEPVRVRGTRATWGLFQALAVAPARGRVIQPEDDRPGADRVALISHRLWQSRYGGRESIVGARIVVNEQPHTVIGVMPSGFDFPPPIVLEGTAPAEKSDIWVPFAMDMSQGQRGAHFMMVLGRLRPGATLEQASQDLDAIAARLESQFPNSNKGWRTRLVPLEEQIVGEIRPQLMVLLAAVGFLLLIACVNVANLLLARGTARRREFAVRAALGASRGRLIRQLIAESQSLSLTGGLLGLALAWWGTQALIQLAPGNLPRLEEVALDWTVAGFALLASLLTGALFGLAPALQAFTPRLGDQLREGGRSLSEFRGAFSLRSFLVVVEVALSIMLLVGAGLLFRSFLALSATDAGFEDEKVISARLSLPASRYSERTQFINAYRELEERLQASPGIASAGFILEIPLAADRQGTALLLEGEPRPDPDDYRQVAFSFATPGYFETMGIPLLRGRRFDARDAQGSENVVLVNQAAVERYFPREGLLGKRVIVGFNSQPRRVVGVVGDVRHDDLREAPAPIVYVPYFQFAWSRNMSLVARTDQPDARAAATIRSQIAAFDRSLPLYDVKAMREVKGESIGRQRFSTLLMGVFSALALVLACVGIYGVISYSVSRRTQETGIRMVMGAQRGDILRLVLTQGLRLALLGVAAGIAASLALARLLSSLLYGVGAADPLTYAAVSALLLAIAALACLIPARRATRVDPMVALRFE